MTNKGRRVLQFIIICLFFPAAALFGQCPDRTVLWERIHSLGQLATGTEVPIMELEGYRSQVKSCAQPGDTVYAYLLQTLGALYNNQSNFRQAIRITYEAIDLLNSAKIDSPGKFPKLADCYYSLGLYYGSLGLVTDKHRSNDSCIQIALNHGAKSEQVLNVFLERAIEFIKTGDDENGYRITRAGLASAQKGELSDSKLARQLATWKLTAQIHMKDLKAAEAEVPERINLFQQLKDTPMVALTLVQLGEILMQKGNLSRSLDYFNEAFVFSKAVNYSDGCAYSLHSMASLYSERLHDIKTAQTYFKQALRYSSSQETASIFKDLATLYYSAGEFDSSRFYLNLVLNKIYPGLHSTNLYRNAEHILDSTNADFIVGLVMGQADLWLKKYSVDSKKPYLDSALAIYRRLDLMFDRLRRTDAGSLSKLFFRNATHRLYEHALEASQLAGNLESALYFLERSRSVILYNDLADMNWLNAEDFNSQVKVEKEILISQRNLAVTTENDPKHDEIRKEILKGRQDLIQLDREIRNKNPICYFTFLDTTEAGMARLQALLNAGNQWLVETFTGDSVVYVLTVTRNSGWMKKLARTGYERLVTDYISLLQDTSALSSHFQQFQETSGRLYRLIFGEDSPPQGRMMISEDRHYFPFEALVSGAGVSGPHYLVDDYPISYVYSARHFISTHLSAPNTNEVEFLGIAPVEFGAFKGLAGLPASDKSIKKAGRYFPGSVVLTGKEATRSKFLEQFYQYNIIQLYSRGADSSSKGIPVIYFADSALYLSDLATGNDLKTRLIVISNLETGTGRNYRGEGVFNLNRGFSALGIPASISNLWKVDNESTYKITELFYQFLSKGMPTDLALQQAKLEYRRTAPDNKKLPTYWTGTILTGTTDQFVVEKGLNWMVFVLGVGVPFLFVFGITFYIYRKRRRA